MARAAYIVLIGILAAGCSSKPRIVVASKNFTEQVLLGEIIAQQIERRTGLEVDRKLNLGGTLLAHEALKGGSIDLYPEYTGTALAAVLKQPLLKDSAATFAKVRDGYRPWGLVWLNALGFNNTFAMVVRSGTAQQYGLQTMSEAAHRPEGWRIGVGYEFVQRADGLSGLVQAYGLRLLGEPTTMDLGLLYGALEAQKIDLAAANATDGRLAHPDFRILQDDLRYFPPYDCAIVVREAALVKYPQLRGALGELSGRISDATMRRMNAAVDIEHRSAVDVAREFLTAGGK